MNPQEWQGEIQNSLKKILDTFTLDDFFMHDDDL